MVEMRVSAFIRHGEPPEVLLIQHCGRGRTYATLPGGTMGEGETLEDTFVRAVYEESGLHVVQDDLLFVADIVDPAAGRPVLHLIFSGTIVGEFHSGLEKYALPSEKADRPYFVPLRSLERQGLSPPIAAHLLGACGGGFREGGRYLVPAWTYFDQNTEDQNADGSVSFDRKLDYDKKEKL